MDIDTDRDNTWSTVHAQKLRIAALRGRMLRDAAFCVSAFKYCALQNGWQHVVECHENKPREKGDGGHFNVVECVKVCGEK